MKVRRQSFAEMAARLFIACGTVFDFANCIEADKGRLLAVSPQPQGFLCSADRAGFSAVLVHDDLGLPAGGAEAVADEIHFRLHDCEVILRSSLQHKARAEGRENGNAGNVEKYSLRRHGRESGENFFRAPTLALKIDNIGLHEYCAAISEHRHGFCRKSEVRVLRYIQAEAFHRQLQKISVAGGALRVELEIFHATVVQNDDLDVLAADIDNHVRIS